MDIYEFYGDDFSWLHKRAQEILRDHDAAYDVLVDVWLKLKDADFSGVDRRKQYVRQIVKNRAIDGWRKQQREPRPISTVWLGDFEDSSDDGRAEDTDARELEIRRFYDDLLAEAIDLLSEEHRVIIGILIRHADDSHAILDELCKDSGKPSERKNQKVRLL